MSKIRYPSIKDMHEELEELQSIIDRILDVNIIDITYNLIVIGDETNEYEYDSIHDAIDEWEPLVDNKFVKIG